MQTMHAAQVTRAGGSLALVEREVRRNAVERWPSSTAAYSQETPAFSALSGGGRPMVEDYRLPRAAEAYDRRKSGKARFKSVLRPDR